MIHDLKKKFISFPVFGSYKVSADIANNFKKMDGILGNIDVDYKSPLARKKENRTQSVLFSSGKSSDKK